MAIATNYYYDSLNGFLTTRTDPDCHSYNYEYDSQNDYLTSVTAPDPTACCDIQNRFSYQNDYLTGITHNGFDL